MGQDWQNQSFLGTGNRLGRQTINRLQPWLERVGVCGPLAWAPLPPLISLGENYSFTSLYFLSEVIDAIWWGLVVETHSFIGHEWHTRFVMDTGRPTALLPQCCGPGLELPSRNLTGRSQKWESHRRADISSPHSCGRLLSLHALGIDKTQENPPKSQSQGSFLRAGDNSECFYNPHAASSVEGGSLNRYRVFEHRLCPNHCGWPVPEADAGVTHREPNQRTEIRILFYF